MAAGKIPSQGSTRDLGLLLVFEGLHLIGCYVYYILYSAIVLLSKEMSKSSRVKSDKMHISHIPITGLKGNHKSFGAISVKFLGLYSLICFICFFFFSFVT